MGFDRTSRDVDLSLYNPVYLRVTKDVFLESVLCRVSVRAVATVDTPAAYLSERGHAYGSLAPDSYMILVIFACQYIRA